MADRQLVSGTLVGITHGPSIIISVGGEERKFPLNCDLTVDWVSPRIGKRVMCQIEDGKVTQVM